MIRKMKREDWELVHPLMNQVHVLHVNKRPDIYHELDPLFFQQFEEILADKNGIYYVYEENSHILGMVIARKKKIGDISIMKKREVYFIEDIVVEETARNKGIGRQLYQAIEKKAAEDRMDAVELNVWACNEEAIRFYEALGMSVKNMRFEKILQKETNIEKKKISLYATSKIEEG